MVLSKQELETLKNFIEEGKGLHYLATVFNTTVSNIKVICYRNGIKISDLRKKSQKGAPSKLKRKSEEYKDIARRLMVLQGLEKVSDSDSDFFFTDEQLKSFIGNPEKFTKEVLDVELQDYQKEMIDYFLNKKRVIICSGRGTGKSFTTAIFLVYNSVINPNQKQLIISPAERQSRLLFDKIHRFIAQNDDLFNSVDFKKSNMEKLVFTNGSEVIPLPSTVFIRGYQNISHIICDEAAFFMNPEQVFASIEPMLSIRNERTGQYGTLILVSSPNGCKGKFWEMYNNPLYEKMQIPSHRNQYISKQWLEEQKQTMSPTVYQQEIEAQFLEATDNFFSIEVINKCSKKYDFTNFPDPNKRHILGVDIGRVKDSSVLCVCSIDSDKTKKIENMIELENKPFSAQIQHIKILHEKYKFFRIVIEKAGLSLPVVEKLKEMGLPIHEFVPTIDNKSKAYNNLLKEMEQGRVVIPAGHQRLQYQLRTFRYEITYLGKMKLHHASAVEGDDFVDALCFSVWGDVQPRPLIIAGRKHGPVLKTPGIPVLEAPTHLENVKKAQNMTWDDKLKYLKKTGGFNLTSI